MDNTPIEQLLQNISSKIGENCTPLEKLPLKDKKGLNTALKQIQSIEHNIQDPTLLRCYLSSNESVKPHLITSTTITNALDLKDILKYANKLTKKEEIIDSANFFQSISETLIKTRSHPKNIRPIVTCLLKWIE